MKSSPSPNEPSSPSDTCIRSQATGLDLASLRPIQATLAVSWFPGVVQLALLALFVALAVLAWGVFTPAGVAPKLFAKSNLVTLVIWGLWWPAMVWAAVFLGRAWCMACPIELLSSGVEKIGRRAGLTGRPLPRWVASGSVIVAIFIVLQLLVPGVQLHRTPGYTAIFLLALLGLAIATSLLFQHRAFCRGFCPAGLLLGTYGRGGMLAVRPGTTDGAPGPDTRTCPTLLNPSRLESSRDCLVCCQCIKASPPGAMRLVLRTPYCAADSRPALASWPVTIFVMVASGFVISELCTEWAAAQSFFLRVPKALAQWWSAPRALPWFEAIWTVFVVPLGLWLMLAGMARAFGRRESPGEFWRRIALPMALLVAAGHMAKGLAKFVSWFPFLPHALREPDGAATALAITGKTLVAPPAMIGLPTVAMISLGLIAGAFILAVREHRLARSGDGPAASVVPYGITSAFFAFLVTGWAIQ